VSGPGRENIVDEIKSRCNIVDVIGRVVSLKRAGSNYKGLCPFHNEKTPSFVVSDTKQIFSCFGCNISGDVIGFVQKYYNLEFPAAVEKLAEEYGIEIQNMYQKSPKKEELYEINRQAAKFFYQAFTKSPNPALSYMNKRGVDPLFLKKFGIGYADDEWDSLCKHFQKLGTDIKLLLSLGLISESKGKYYDKFRNRVIFPIINTSGKVIGFGGRTLGDGAPKYLNSAESDIFLKKNNLYGLNLTKQDISKEDSAILVEGYMDVISLYQSGIRNVSASLGTALTENQVRLLKRYTRNIILSYDSDEAGASAALRGGEILHKEGCRTKVLQVPSAKDPDEFIKENGKNDFLKLVGEAPPYLDFKLNRMKKNYDITSTEGKVDFIREAVVLLRTLSPVEAEAYIKRISRDTKISESAITLEYNGNNTKKVQLIGKLGGDEHISEKASEKISGLEKNFLKMALTERVYFDKITFYEHAFTSKAGFEIWNEIKTNYEAGKTLDITCLPDALDTETSMALQDILDNVHFAGKEDQIFLECVDTMEMDEMLQKERELILKLSMADEVASKESITELTKALMEVQKGLQRKKR